MAPADSEDQILLSALEKCDFSTPLWRNRVSEMQTKKTSVVMKRKACLNRPRKAIERKVRTLKRLIPNCESVEVEGLFRETADYIVALQMKLKVMQILVDVLSGCDDDDDDDDK